MKAKSVKKSGASLRHQPFAEDIEKPTGKLKAQKQEAESEPDDIAYAEEFMTDDVATSVVKAAREQQREFLTDRFNNEGDIFVEHDTGSESDEQVFNLENTLTV